MAETREEKKKKKKKKRKNRKKKKSGRRGRRRARKKTGWRNEGREFELNYILISRPFRSAHRDMPNIRRNLHFKLDTSCYDPRVSPVVGEIVWRGCCRFCKKHARLPRLCDGDFQKLQRTRCASILSKNQPDISSPSRTFYPRVFHFFRTTPFQIYISIFLTKFSYVSS